MKTNQELIKSIEEIIGHSDDCLGETGYEDDCNCYIKKLVRLFSLYQNHIRSEVKRLRKKNIKNSETMSPDAFLAYDVALDDVLKIK